MTTQVVCRSVSKTLDMWIRTCYNNDQIARRKLLEAKGD
jgi:hypothetical protein